MVIGCGDDVDIVLDDFGVSCKYVEICVMIDGFYLVVLVCDFVFIGCNFELMLVFDDDYVLGWYVWIYFENGEWFVEDFGLINGIFVGK